MDIADLFIQEFLLEEFDKKPLEQQALEVENLEEKWRLYKARYIKNCGSKGGAPKKHSPETIEFIIEEKNKIKKTPGYKKRKRANSIDSTAYQMLVEKVLSDPEIEKLFIEQEWLSPYMHMRQGEIKRIAKSFQQTEQRYKKSKRSTGT